MSGAEDVLRPRSGLREKIRGFFSRADALALADQEGEDQKQSHIRPPGCSPAAAHGTGGLRCLPPALQARQNTRIGNIQFSHPIAGEMLTRYEVEDWLEAWPKEWFRHSVIKDAKDTLQDRIVILWEVESKTAWTHKLEREPLYSLAHIDLNLLEPDLWQPISSSAAYALFHLATANMLGMSPPSRGSNRGIDLFSVGAIAAVFVAGVA